MIFATARPRRLPAVRVYGVTYVVDVQHRLLRQVDDPRRVIWFERESGDG